MTKRAKEIWEAVAGLADVRILDELKEEGPKISFHVEVCEGEAVLPFEVEIFALYPMQFHDAETIRFVNKELLAYDHVNADGSICVHTLHSAELLQKLRLDFHYLRHWINKYYIPSERDTRYEHIVVNDKATGGTETVFLFTDVDYRFTANEFGAFSYSYLATGVKKGAGIVTNLVQSFNVKKRNIQCGWSREYRKGEKKQGLFCFLESSPVKNRRFAVENWQEMEPFVNQAFIQFLFANYQRLVNNEESPYVPLLLGYAISETENHWQAVMLPAKSFPITRNKVLNSYKYLGQFLNQEILWCQTRNCSYQFYFGRGALHERITKAKILVIGLGAIGSMVAKSLVRGGAVNITLVDYDVKEPENVCRSEYDFYTGICNKAVELHNVLHQISPFVDVRHSEELMDKVKIWSNIENVTKPFEDLFGEYDLIFDCTTDNDVASLLDRLQISTQVYCLSITNEAKELVCATKPNLYGWLAQIFEKLKGGASQELYHPTGCWSPTFKAGYTDIAVLVQWAIKQINACYTLGLPVRNFVIAATESENFFQPKLIQY